MRGNSWLFVLMLLVGLAASNPIQGQRIAYTRLVGQWVAIEPAEEDTFIAKDGQRVPFKGRPAIIITLDFKPDNHASLKIKDGASIKFQPFTYQLLNSGLIERRYPSGGKSVRETLTINNNKLWLAPYPMPKQPQESIDLLYSLTFVKQP